MTGGVYVYLVETFDGWDAWFGTTAEPPPFVGVLRILGPVVPRGGGYSSMVDAVQFLFREAGITHVDFAAPANAPYLIPRKPSE